MRANIQKIVLLGTGNVATQLGKAIRGSGMQLLQIYGRSPQKAQQLAELLGCDCSSSWDDLAAGADLYVLAISDDGIEKAAQAFPFKDAFLVHTSGSTPMQALESCNRSGVLYPLQTLSKNLDVDFQQVPLCLEAARDHDFQMLEDFARRLSQHVYRTGSDQRRVLHAAAVFACNFTNHMYTLAEDLMNHHRLPFEMLRPLIGETARKAMLESPSRVQTGPAIRQDQNTLKAHNSLLMPLEDHRKLYNFISKSIISRHRPESNHSS